MLFLVLIFSYYYYYYYYYCYYYYYYDYYYYYYYYCYSLNKSIHYKSINRSSNIEILSWVLLISARLSMSVLYIAQSFCRQTSKNFYICAYVIPADTFTKIQIWGHVA